MKKQKGFTLIELLVVIAIIGLLSSIVLASLSTARKKGRDAKRLSDMKQIRTALEIYYNDYGQYPASLPADSDGCRDIGYDASDPSDTFIPGLETSGAISKVPGDPIFGGTSCVGDDTGAGYFYWRYEPPYATCPTDKGAFFVLAVDDMETSTGRHPSSPGFDCLVGRVWWNNNLEWVTGSFESN